MKTLDMAHEKSGLGCQQVSSGELESCAIYGVARLRQKVHTTYVRSIDRQTRYGPWTDREPTSKHYILSYWLTIIYLNTWHRLFYRTAFQFVQLMSKFRNPGIRTHVIGSTGTPARCIRTVYGNQDDS